MRRNITPGAAAVKPGRQAPLPARSQLLQRLARTGRAHSDATVIFHAEIARRLGLHPTDYKTLGVLQRLGAMSAGELAAHTGLATASVTSLIDRLERKAFVRRVRDAADRRRVIVEPVAERLTAAERLFASTRASLARLLERYSGPELLVIADFLDRNAARLTAETRRAAARQRSSGQ